jgi:hypothetical protein
MRELPRKSRLVARAAGALGITMVLIIVALTTGSISIAFLQDRVASAVHKNLPADADFAVADIRASLGLGTIVVDLREVGLTVPGQAGVTVERLKTHLGLWSLLAGRVKPVEIEADGISVDLERRPQAVHPAGSRAQHFREAAASISSAANRIGSALQGRGLELIAVSDIRINGEAFANTPIATNLPLQVSDLEWTLGETGSDITIEFQSDQGQWTLKVETGALPDGQTYTELAVSGFPPSFLLSQLTDPERRPNYDAIADLSGRIVTDPDGAFASAGIRLAFGPGHLAILRRDRTAIDSIVAAVELPPAGNVVNLVEGDIRSAGNQVAFTAALDLGAFGAPMAFDCNLGKSRLLGLAGDDAPVLLNTGYARGSVDPAAGRIMLDRAFVSGPEGAVSLNGGFIANGDDAGLSGVLQVEETTARMVNALWPPLVARQARNWFQANIKTGLVGPGQLAIKLPKDHLGPQGRDRMLPVDSLIGEIPFRFGMFSPTPQLPLVRRSSGFVRFADAAVMVSLRQAEVVATGVGSANVLQSYFRIPDLGRPGAVGYLDLRLAGPVPVLAQLSNSGPLSIAADRGLEPKDLSGEGELELFAEIPLGDRITRESVHAEFKLDLAGFASATPMRGGRRVSSANLVVAGTLDAHEIDGDAIIDGIPAQIHIRSDTHKANPTVRLTLEEDAQRQLGIELRPFLSGPIIALVDPDADNLKTVSLDLTPTDINLPFLGWHKLPGVAARFTARMEKSPNGTELSRIVFSGDEFQATGELAIDAQGNLVSLEAQKIRLRPDENFSISVKRSGGRLQVRVTGEAIDARGIISALQQPAEAEETAPTAIDISLNVDRLIGHNNIELADIAGRATFVGGQPDSLSIKAGPDDRHTIEISVDPQTQERNLVARFGNAGDILRFLNVYRTAYGGGMAVKFGGPAETGDGKGHVSISGFRVSESGRKIAVSRLSIPFSRKAHTISIYKAAMVADGLDATAKGAINLQSRYMSIRGTIVPTNGLNRLPASVPILGDLLGAKKRKGLIGIAFTLAGSLSSPELKLNVASAVTPGIVRRLFGK